MSARFPAVVGLVLAILLAPLPSPAQAPPTEEQRIIVDATTVFDEMLRAPGVRIPRSMLSGAEAVVIVPRVVKGGFIVGARYGRGVVIARDPQGVWHTPMFLTITGGNVGWQAGVQATDLVLVYRTPRSVNSLLSGKLTIGADVAAAAGPVGREAGAATDTTFTAEVYSYSRSRGLFAGVALDGSVLKIDHAATAAYYQPLGGPAAVPPEAQALAAKVVQLTGATSTSPPPEPSTTATPPAAANPAGLAAPVTVEETAAIRSQLADFAPRLYHQLDPQWQAYLSLPASVFQESGHPTAAELAPIVARFDRVAAEPQFANLAALPEFQTTRGLLRQYVQVLDNAPRKLSLPPPPAP